MKKIIFLLLILFSVSLILADGEIKSIRDVVFEPRSNIEVHKKFLISIPDAWTREILSNKDNKNDLTYIFADLKPEFSPSIMIKFEDDNGDKFESIKETYMKKVYGKEIKEAAVQPILYKYLDPAASEKYIVYGPHFLTGNAFLCLLHYKDIKKTAVIVYNLIYVNAFTEKEWFYIIKNSSNILVSMRKI